MNKKKLTVLIPILLSTGALAKSPTTNWDSDVVENYLHQGNEVTKLTDTDNRSRWYSTVRFRARSQYKTEDGSKKDQINSFLQGNLRLRGKSMMTDDTGFFGDFWLKAQENYVKVDDQTTNSFTGRLNDSIGWEQFRFGFESNALGALMLAKHTATWAMFASDIGALGLNNGQGDMGGKNEDKIIYKHHFDNNLFVNASYDCDSDITGFDLGYQTADIYSYMPDSYGIYLSTHNGQPGLENGADNWILGNVDNTTNIESDSGLNRHDDSQYTYTLAGFKQIGIKHRYAANVSYSDRTESVDEIKARGFTTGGLGLSASASYQMFPDNFHGFSPIITVAQDEFGTTVAPELQYFIKPYMRAWVVYNYESDGQDMARVEFQADF